MIRFRAHHVLCLQFFEGKGYNKHFIENLKNILQKLNEGEKVKIIEGEDDVCKCCPHLNTLDKRCMLNKKVEEKDQKTLKVFNLCIGEEVSWNEIVQRFKMLSSKDILNICKGCFWEDTCLKKIKE